MMRRRDLPHIVEPAPVLVAGTIEGIGVFATVAHGTSNDSVLAASATLCLHER